jgi:hypothetical protein
MSTIRVTLAFLLVPLIPAVGYYGFYALLSPSRGHGVPDFMPFLLAIFPLSYGFTVLLWLPLFVVFRRLGWSRLWHYVVAGAVLGTAVAVISTGSLSREFGMFVLTCTFIGAGYAAVFWQIALGPPPARTL